MTETSEPAAVDSPEPVRHALRRAIAAAGFDPDEVERQAEKVDLSAPAEHQVLPLFEPPPKFRRWYDE